MEPFKNKLGPHAVDAIARALCHACPQLAQADVQARFTKPLKARLGPLKLKARAAVIAEALATEMPGDFGAACEILIAMLHPSVEGSGDWGTGQASKTAPDNTEPDHPGLRGWPVWPLCIVVARLGRNDPEHAVATLREMTMRFTAEFEIRPFLQDDQAGTLRILARWLHDPNEHVRRWISEGTRPRLPWGIRLSALVDDPRPVLPLLEGLRDDPSEYVRRSVANHLNDISKDHPELVVDLARLWMREAPKTRVKLLRHALRGLIKSGDAGALAVFGQHPPKVTLGALKLSHETVQLGAGLGISCEIFSQDTGSQDLTIDYVMWYLKADGRRAPKVFKGARVTLLPGKSLVFARTHRFRDVTTRRHYAGMHEVGLRINGRDFATSRFSLIL